MPRMRMVKPEFFTDEDLGKLTPTARLFFIGLWTQADRRGRLEERHGRLKANILPYDDVDVGELLDELVRARFVVRYTGTVPGPGGGPRKFLQVRTFERHQRPHIKEQESTIPAPAKHGASHSLAPTLHRATHLPATALQPGVGVGVGINPTPLPPPLAGAGEYDLPPGLVASLSRTNGNGHDPRRVHYDAHGRAEENQRVEDARRYAMHIGYHPSRRDMRKLREWINGGWTLAELQRGLDEMRAGGEPIAPPRRILRA